MEKRETILESVITTTGKGVGFIRHESVKELVRIEQEFLKTSLHGDRVAVRLLPSPRGEKERRGEVVTILARAKKTLVGTIIRKNNAVFVAPDDRHIYRDIRIPNPPPQVADNTKVFVKLAPWTDPKKDPEGDVIEIIGQKGAHEVETRAILLERGIAAEFPPEVEAAAAEIKRTKGRVTAGDLAARRDFRNIPTFTIDPEDAKDFDDALSVVEIPDATYEIGIHIADVSHYVLPGTAIDEEARRRGFSTYLVDRTIPMLPAALSEDLCSLNPHEDKFAFSAVFTVDRNARVRTRWFGKSVIHSDTRFTYEKAQRVLDAGAGPHWRELSALRALGRSLAKRRTSGGAIDFGDNEFKCELDDAGRPLRIYRKERLETNRIIEDFMLLANREVAEFIHRGEKRRNARMLIYRVHDLPNAEKLEDLALFLRALGHHLPGSRRKITAQSINALFRDIEGSPLETLVKTATLRTMAKAAYSTKNIGHFGLGFATYTHFTSPIRRYADLLVHRFLEAELHGKHPEQTHARFFEQLAFDLSQKEVASVEAERASIRRKQVEYLAAHIGTERTGIISGVSEWGIFVADSATGAEGLVRLRDMGDDYYVLDAKRYHIRGARKKKTYALGDTVRVKVIAADTDRSMLDFAITR